MGRFVEIDSILDSDVGSYIETRRTIDTHKNGMELMHSINGIKKQVGIKQSKLKTILERLFRNNSYSRNKILRLDTKTFYAFIINNEVQLRREFEEATSQMAVQSSMVMAPKTSEFRIPCEDLIRYDAAETDVVEILSNAELLG